MASGESRFSPCSNQQDCRPCHRHTRRRPRPHIPIGARRDRENPTRPLRILMENRQQHRDSARHRNRRQATPLNIVAHLLMLKPIPGTFLIVMFMPGCLVIVAVVMMRPVAVILRRPLHLPFTIAPIPTRHAKRLRAQQSRAAEHGEQPEIWQGAVHARVISLETSGSARPFTCAPPERPRTILHHTTRPVSHRAGMVAASGRGDGRCRRHGFLDRLPRHKWVGEFHPDLFASRHLGVGQQTGIQHPAQCGFVHAAADEHEFLASVAPRLFPIAPDAAERFPASGQRSCGTAAHQSAAGR